MFGLIKDIKFDEIIGGQFIIGLKIPVRNGSVDIVYRKFIQICEIVGIDQTEIYKLTGEVASIEISKFTGFFNLPFLKNSSLVFKNMGTYVVIGLEFDADEIHNGNITLKDLKIIEKFRGLSGGPSLKFVALIK